MSTPYTDTDAPSCALLDADPHVRGDRALYQLQAAARRAPQDALLAEMAAARQVQLHIEVLMERLAEEERALERQLRAAQEQLAQTRSVFDAEQYRRGVFRS